MSKSECDCGYGKGRVYIHMPDCPVMVDVPPRPAPAASEVGEYGWLIEHKASPHGPEWLFFETPDKQFSASRSWMQFTKDASQAVRFSRKVDAEATLKMLQMGGLDWLVPTEHKWIEPLSRQPGEDDVESRVIGAGSPTLLGAAQVALVALDAVYVDWDGEPEDMIPIQDAISILRAAIAAMQAKPSVEQGVLDEREAYDLGAEAMRAAIVDRLAEWVKSLSGMDACNFASARVVAQTMPCPAIRSRGAS